MPVALLPVLLLLLGSPLNTRSEAFEVRVALGKQAEAEPNISFYQAKMFGAVGQALATAMKACTANKSERDMASFTLVADISPIGRAEGVAVQPVTPVATCLSNAFSRLDFPNPPPFHDRGGFPVVIDMKIAK